jgi:hypothetical protein
VFLWIERYILPICAAVVVGAVILNPFKLDWQQRIAGEICISAFAYFVAHTIHKPKVATAVAATDPRVEILQEQVNDLRAQQQKLLDQREESERVGNKKAEISKHLSDFITEGVQLRNKWQEHLGQPEQVQKQDANGVQLWHRKIESYLKTIPQGDVYIARFQGSVRTSGSYPVGINVNLAGLWDSLMSDIAKLNEFIKEADLGRS